jgi:hypothetical protein
MNELSKPFLVVIGFLILPILTSFMIVQIIRVKTGYQDIINRIRKEK